MNVTTKNRIWVRFVLFPQWFTINKYALDLQRKLNHEKRKRKCTELSNATLATIHWFPLYKRNQTARLLVRLCLRKKQCSCEPNKQWWTFGRPWAPIWKQSDADMRMKTYKMLMTLVHLSRWWHLPQWSIKFGMPNVYISGPTLIAHVFVLIVSPVQKYHWFGELDGPLIDLRLGAGKLCKLPYFMEINPNVTKKCPTVSPGWFLIVFTR